MITPRLGAVTLVVLAAACGEPGSVPQVVTPPPVTAVFDPITGNIPLPNDLARQPRPPGTPPFPAAQQDLLNLFNAQGGFPSDQELPVTISIVRTQVAQDGTITNTAPTALDTTTFNATTLAIFLKTPDGASGLAAYDPVTDADYVAAGDHGVLTIHNRNHAPWAPGQYVLGMRGGPNGVKTKEGDPIYASSTFYLIAQGQNLENEQNLTLLRAQTGSEAAARAAAQQLDQIINGYNQGAFPAINQVFPHQELAAMTTFAIAPVSTVVVVDSARGIVPLPIDLLRDPRTVSTSCSACGKLTPLAACTFAQGTLDAQGVCRDSKGNVDAAAVGFAAIDGFSTTGMILAQTSDLIAARTVTPSTVQLWEVPASGSPVKVDLNTYISEPCEVTSSCDPNVTTALSPVIALQPAGATALDNSGSPVPSVFRTRPLKDKTDYAVVISDGVRDKTDKAISRSTVARILQFTNPLSVGGKSQLIGIDDATAGALEAMRLKIAPVVAASGFATDHVAIAYTFHTQSILSTAVQLGALPYSKDPSTALPAAPTALTVANAFAKYGVGSTVANTGNVAEVLETTITTFNLIDPANGAFNQTGATANETINVLIAYPDAATVTFPACPAALAPFGKKCSPLVVFRHGIGRGRADILTVADTLAGKGFTVVAIDAAKHGDRSFCVSGQTNVTGTTLPQCAGGGTCNAIPGTQGQADANPPGTCSAGFTYQAVSPACNLNPASCGPWTGAQGIPVVSSSFLISANFFRTRDTFRQDIIDQSQLVRAIAFVPSGPPPTAHPLFDHLFGKGVIIDPGQVFFVGQSLGAIQGTLDVAANPRVSTAVLNVGGGTLVDVFTTSRAFSASTNTLLASLGIQAGANSDYLKFLVVAKTVLDPADPVNFAGHLTDPATTLPNLLADPNGSVRQSAKQVLTQVAFCDQTVPNPWNYILDSTAGTGPFPGFPGFGGPGTFQLFFKGSATPSTLASCPTPSSTSTNAIPHGFFTAWTAGATAQTAQAQSDAAAFLVDPAANKPASLRTF